MITDAHQLLERHEFRKRTFDRDDDTCVVPWCTETADDAHHIIERSCWVDEGYYLANGASVCNPHHQAAEEKAIPPQAFWHWLDVEPITPEGMAKNVDKWGEELEQPPWKQHRERIKYPSTGHLPFSPEWDGRRNDYRSLESLVDVPLVVTTKMDGSNAMLTKDLENPVRARNGKHAEHQSFDYLKQLYFDRGIYEELPGHIQIFGEWLYARHSIHYGCDCNPRCDDVGPALKDYFQLFGVYDTRLDLWLSWDAVEEWADRIGFPTVPKLEETRFDREDEIYRLNDLAERVVADGHEGITVRSRFPYHFAQFERRVAKYVRDGHVDPEADHWKHRTVIQNQLSATAD